MTEGSGSAGKAALPYRPNVGAVLFNRAGQVLVARRADRANAGGQSGEGIGGWQLPQGGIDEDEDPARAVLRELEEEIGTAEVEILGEYPGWLQYDLPARLIGKSFRGRYRGQRQRWFALLFLGEDAQIRLDLDPHPEFDMWRWTELDALPQLAVDFKRPIYEALAREFRKYADRLKASCSVRGSRS